MNKHTTTTPEIKEKEPKKLKGNKLSIWAVLLAMLSGSPSAEFIAPITIWTSAALVTACDEKQLTIEDKKPTIDLKISTIDITWGKKVNIENNTLYIWGQKVATWSDNETKNCTVTLLLNWERILSWDTISEPGTLTLQVMDWAQQKVSKTIQLTETIVNGAPTIDIKKPEVDVSQWKEVIIGDDKLTIWWEEIATWSDDRTKKCEVTLSFDWKEVKSKDVLKDAGTLTLTVTDEDEKSDTKTIKLNVVNNEPVIKVEKEQLNIYWGATVNISNNQLMLWDELMASWSDDRTEKCEVSLMFNWSEVKSWDTLNWEWKLVLTISDGEWKSSSVEFTLTNETTEAIFWLENLQSLNLKVEKEVNLLQWLTLANGVSLKRVEVQLNGWAKEEVQDPAHYIPEYPWDITIILTVDNNWVEEVKEVTISCAPLDYIAPSFNSVDYINQQYSWFNVMSPKKQEFIRGHLLTSYVNAEWFRKDNMVYIIMGEVPVDIPSCENVGKQDVTPNFHAKFWYIHQYNITPTAIIKACWWNRSNLKDYVDKHPELDFVVGCAADALWWDSPSSLSSNPRYENLTELLKKENIIINVASWNLWWSMTKILNEIQSPQQSWDYSSASVNSRKNNKNTIVWYNPNQNNIFLDDNWSLLPVWDWFWPWNRVFPFITLVDELNHEITDQQTDSSYPTAAASSTQWNFLSILKSNYPWTTLEDANTILINKYYIEQPYYYKDTYWSIKEWGKWYFIDVEKFLEEEVLRKSEVLRAIDSSAPPQNDNGAAGQNDNQAIALPSGAGLCYSGMGIMFEVDGQRYPMTETNRQILEEAVKSGKDISWSWSKILSLKQGGPATPSIEVRYLDTKARIIPDLCFSVELK